MTQSHHLTCASTLAVISLIFLLASCEQISSCSFTYSSLSSCSFLAFSSRDLWKKFDISLTVALQACVTLKFQTQPKAVFHPTIIYNIRASGKFDYRPGQMTCGRTDCWKKVACVQTSLILQISRRCLNSGLKGHSHEDFADFWSELC